MTDRLRFERLVVPHADALWALARRLSGEDGRADDLLQNSLLTALQRIGGLRADEAARTWAARIVVRAWLDEARRGARALVAAGGAPEAAAAEPDPAHRLDAREVGDRLAAAFDTLPDDQRAAVWLVDAEGFTFAEAAEALGVAPGTAASRVARGRAALRLLLADLAPTRSAP